MVTLLLSMSSLLSLYSIKRAVFVELNCLYADCDILDKSLVQMCHLRWLVKPFQVLLK